jgi:acyl carrier protein
MEAKPMLEQLANLVYDQTGDHSVEITRDTVLLADLGMNSFDLVNLVCVVEDEFEVEIPDRVIGTFKTVGDVIDFIEKQ